MGEDYAWFYDTEHDDMMIILMKLLVNSVNSDLKKDFHQTAYYSHK